MRISFIIPTIGRVEEVDNLLQSILKINYKDIEVIIVDQNPKGLLEPIVLKYKNEFSLKHLLVDFKGAAQARNYGFNFSTGEIINFPDDDCTLSNNVIENALEVFNNTKSQFVFGRTIDAVTKNTTCLNFSLHEEIVTIENLYNTTIECTMFCTRDAFKSLNGYDENLGVGKYFGSGENADLVYRAIYKKYKLIYNPKIIFYHPDKLTTEYTETEFRRGRSFCRGKGALVIKHIVKFRKYKFLRYILKDFFIMTAAMIYNLLLWRRSKVKYHYYCLVGFVEGVIIYFFKLKSVRI